MTTTSLELLAYVEDDIKNTWYDLGVNRRLRDIHTDPYLRGMYAGEARDNVKNLQRLFRIRRRELGRA